MPGVQDNHCSKKDKRLLVLLAFGVMVMVLSLEKTPPDTQVSQRQMWVELQGSSKELYRLTEIRQGNTILQDLESQSKLIVGKQQFLANIKASWEHEDRFIAWQNTGAGGYKPAAASPVLSYFLEQRVPVNRADKSALELVPGIGPYLSENIIEYRKRNGNIDSPQELKAIPGIGKSRSKKLSPFLSFK